MAETIRIDGLEEVRRALVETPVELRKKVIYRLLRKAAQPMVRAARASAPRASKATRRVIPGLLQRSIGVRTSRIKQASRGEFGVFITATTPPGVKRLKRSARKSGVAGPNFGDPFYHRFQEGGFHAVGGLRVGGARSTGNDRLGRLRYVRGIFSRKTNLTLAVRAGTARFIPGLKYLGRAYEAHRQSFVDTFRVDVVSAAVEAFNRMVKK